MKSDMSKNEERFRRLFDLSKSTLKITFVNNNPVPTVRTNWFGFYELPESTEVGPLDASVLHDRIDKIPRWRVIASLRTW